MRRLIPYIVIGLFATSFGWTGNQNCISELFQTIDIGLAEQYDKVESESSFGVRHTIDSLNYSIIRRWKSDMTPIIESITNSLINIDSWKEYHANGQLKAVGFMTTSLHTPIGEWKYYAESGKLDSVVDYSVKYKVSFCEFYQIAKERGLTGKTSIMNFDTRQRKWRVEKWDYDREAYSYAIGIELQVDSMEVEKIDLIGIR